MKHLKKSLKLGALLFACTVFSAGAESWPDWMGKINDDPYIRHMSIPGAHDAATGHGFSSGLSILSGYTQSLTISELWDAGIRAFDLRPKYQDDADGDLQIYHGSLATKMTMKAALQTLVDKLNTYPSETAIILMQNEGDSDGDKWASAMTALLKEFDSYIVKWNQSLRLNDKTRGKIIIMTRDEFDKSTTAKAGVISEWTDNCTYEEQKIILGTDYGFNLHVQDYYNCGNPDNKYKAVITLLDYSLANKNSVWVINHTSGYTNGVGFNNYVQELAEDINKSVAEYINKSTAGRTGMVFMDYAGDEDYYGDDLIDAIIMQNTKYMTTGAELIESEVESVETDDCIYDITGRLVGRGEDALNNLSNGFYIVNGKKVIIRN